MICNIIKLIICSFLFVNTLSFANEMALCRIFYQSMYNDHKLTSFEDRLNAWKEYEQRCSSKGAYKLYLANLYYENHYFKEAIDILESEILTAEYDTRKHKKFLCGMYSSIEHLDKLNALAEELIEKYPTWYGGYVCQGHLYYEEKKWQAAMNSYEYSTTIDSSHAGIFLRLAVIAYELENYKKTVDYYTIALHIESRRAIACQEVSAMAAIASVKMGEFLFAKDILEYQQLSHKDIHEYEWFQKAKRYYERELKETKG